MNTVMADRMKMVEGLVPGACVRGYRKTKPSPKIREGPIFLLFLDYRAYFPHPDEKLGQPDPSR